MVKSFIERLTDEQVKIFLDRHYPKEEKYSYGFDKDEYSVYVRMDRNHGNNSFNFSLKEYDNQPQVKNIPVTKGWYIFNKFFHTFIAFYKKYDIL